MSAVQNLIHRKAFKKMAVLLVSVVVIFSVLNYYYIPDKVYSFFLEQGPFHVPAYDTLIKGELFFYTGRYEEMTPLSMLTNYKVVITNDFLSKENVTYLHNHQVKLVYYEWFIATYQPDMVPNATWILGTDSGPYGTAYFYDFGDLSFQDWFVDYINNKIENHNYDGVFFDHFGPIEYYTGLAKNLYTKYTQRHPDYSIEIAMQDFLLKLRNRLQNKIIVSNQGYRSGADFLRFVDYDISESYFATYGGKMTIYVEGVGLCNVSTTIVRPWNNWSWNSPRVYVPELIISVLNQLYEKYGKTVKFLHLNYLGPYYVPSGKTIEVNGTTYETYIYKGNNPNIEAYCYAGAIMFDQYSQPTYMFDLGNPLTDVIDLFNGTVSVRYFEKGFIVIDGANKSIDFKPDMEFVKSTILYDHVTGDYYFLRRTGYVLNIPLTVDPLTNEPIPTVRIFLYAYTFTK